ncbi:hypothetical protein [Streptomyces sp. NPDC001889]
MKIRLFSALSGALGLLLVLPAAAGAVPGAPAGAGAQRAVAPAPLAEGPAAVAEAFREGPVHVDPRASGQLSRAEARALSDRIRKSGRPLFVAVLPVAGEFAPDGLLRNLRAATGIAGLYAVRLGDGFDAGADGAVLPRGTVRDLVATVRTPPGGDAAAQLDSFAGLALPRMSGAAPASWGTPEARTADDGTKTGVLIALGAALVAGALLVYGIVRSRRRGKAAEERAALDRLRVVVDEDITAFGEELDRLDFHPSERGADDAMRADYERALDAYDTAKSAMASARRPSDVRAVTTALDDGRFGLAALDARRTGRPVPERRPPCFFDPRHGLSVAERSWAPQGCPARDVPVCAADAARLDDHLAPLARTVETETGRRPYWEAGPAYGPWAGGYFGGGLLPGLLAGTMLGAVLSSPAYAAEYGGDDFASGAFSSSDFDSSDFGGFGGGFDGGGGGDLGGGGFGGGSDGGGGM